MAAKLTPPPNFLGLTFPTTTEDTDGDDGFLSIPAGAVIVTIGILFLICCLVPIIISCICWCKHPIDDRKEESEKLLKQKSKEQEQKVPVNEKIKRLNMKELLKKHKERFAKDGPPDRMAVIMDVEVLVERKPTDGTSVPLTTHKKDADGGKGRKNQMNVEESRRLTIQPSIFEKVFKKMIFKPTLLEIMKADERDPKKTLVQNWFEYCQPEFEIPAEIIALSLANPDSCIDAEIHAWDQTAYLVEDKFFIHASVVPMPGEGELGKVIICQAPMDEKFPGKKDTRGPFWKMVQEVKADYVVMACQIVENKKIKCGKYFPEKVDQSLTYGDMTVTLADAREMYEGELMVRKFTYHNKVDKDIIRKVTHFQFLKWKERAIPVGDMALEAIKFVNEQVRRQSNPYICHSSLGTGRACVFAGIEYMCSMVCNKSRVSTHFFQIDYRTKRMGALQTGEQLYFVQNMAFELLIKEFNFYRFQQDMKHEWKRLAHYYDKGAWNKKALQELEEYEKGKPGGIVPFTSKGKRPCILTVTAPEPTQASYKEQKTQTMEDPDANELRLRMNAVRKSKSALKLDTKGATTSKEGTSVDTTVAQTENTTMSQLPIESVPKQDNVEQMDLDAEEK